MDDLKSIWNQINCDSEKLKMTMNKHKETVFEKLRHEQRLRKRYNPLLVVLILLFSFIFSYIVFQNETEVSFAKIIGVSSIILASVIIAIFPQIVKMPLNQFEHDKSSIIFLKTVKSKLDQSKFMLIIGLVLQIIFLTLGLYMIIFYSQDNISTGHIYTFFGFMFGLAGLSIGGGFTFFNSHYKSTYQLINHFLDE